MVSMDTSVERLLERVLGETPTRLTRLSGGCIAQVYRFEAGGHARVAKLGDGAFVTEGWMLGVLRDAGARVPSVIHASPDVLVMEHIPSDGTKSEAGERGLAKHLADLHSQTSDRYGCDRATPIGPLIQDNTPEPSWPLFFARRRLLPFAEEAARHGGLQGSCLPRIERLVSALPELIGEPSAPSLVHGDLWAGNVLWNSGMPAGLIDPAIYFADPEVELAFIDLMGGMSGAFWDAYQRANPIRSGFWETRRTLYQLYPLMVHARLFGDGYGSQVERGLRALGF